MLLSIDPGVVSCGVVVMDVGYSSQVVNNCIDMTKLTYSIVYSQCINLEKTTNSKDICLNTKQLIDILCRLHISYSFDTIAVELQMKGGPRGMYKNMVNNWCIQGAIISFAVSKSIPITIVKPQNWHSRFALTGMKKTLKLYKELGVLNGVVGTEKLTTIHQMDAAMIAITGINK